MNYKQGNYSQKQLNKKKYIRKNKHNKIYAGKHTQRELEKRVKQARIFIIVLFITVCVSYANAENSKTILNDGMVKAEPIVASQSEVVSDNLIASVDVDWSTLPYIEKDKGTVEERIKKAFPEDPNTALAIAKCESMLDKNAIGDTHTKYCSVGLMQIRTLPKRMAYYGLTIESLKDIDKNLEIARLIKDRRGNWTAWSCFTSGEYKKHL